MGGANSIVNVFDVKSYDKNGQNIMHQMSQPKGSFDDMVAQKNMQNVPKQRYGTEMLVKKEKDGEESKEELMTDALNNGRLKNNNDYEISKYMQNDIKPVHLPDIPTYMRAENADPGQSSPRS